MGTSITLEQNTSAAAASLEACFEADRGDETAARSFLRVLYRRNLVSRAWPRRRVGPTGPGGHYIASAAVAVARSAMQKISKMKKHETAGNETKTSPIKARVYTCSRK